MSTPHHLAAQRLSAQFGWRLLTIPDWAAAAYEIDPSPADDKAARNTCLTVYSRTLYEACQDRKHQEQAYSELHRYLWPQAYDRDSDLAADATQRALLRIFEALQSPSSNRGPQSAIVFLRFCQYMLCQAIRDERRQRLLAPERVISLDASPPGEAAEGETWGERVPNPSPSPEETVVADEADTAYQQQVDAVLPRLPRTVLESLQTLWKNRTERQISAVVFTYFDQAGDDAIATHLHTNPKNVQPLRSRGLDKVHTELNARLAYGQGDYA
ncbi:MAG: hypothetical protein K1X65_05695 [Caldilineales bacterium]|nr:hypothetical protein [Caldilineales bacterium]MCW5857145.1 hypothetical protein [Caldilineales bacterium]